MNNYLNNNFSFIIELSGNHDGMDVNVQIINVRSDSCVKSYNWSQQWQSINDFKRSYGLVGLKYVYITRLK